MRILEPFLLRFKTDCLSPRRVGPNQEYRYDADLQMVMTIEDGEYIPAIESARRDGPRTKKADLEKGEDQKDGRRWR